jgi:hypothetical protein
MEIVRDIVRNRLAKGDAPYDRFIAEFLNRPRWGKSPLEVRAFVVSFCGQCSKASQSLHFCRSGTGVALGFRPNLPEVVKRTLWKIDYDPDTQRSFLNRLIEAICPLLSSSSPTKDRDSRLAAQVVTTWILAAAASMKHPSFRDEDEWRLVGIDLRVDHKPLTPTPPGRLQMEKYRRQNRAVRGVELRGSS